jgi:hypothetical protein
MKIKLLNSKFYKFGISLAKGEIRECRVNDGIYQVEANKKGSGVWLSLKKKDFEVVEA